MFSKLVTVLLITGYLANSGDAFGDDVWPTLTATWPYPGNEGPYSLPVNIDDAVNDGWTEIEGAKPSSADSQEALNYYNSIIVPGTLDVTSCKGYKGNARFVMCFNSLGDVVAIQNAIPTEDLKKQDMPIDYDNHVGIVTKTLNDVEHYVVVVYLFVDANGNRRMFYVDSSGLNEVGTNDAQLAGSKFLKKTCVPTMGGHRYQLTSTSDCGTFHPLVLITNGSEVIGFAVQIIGTTSTDSTRVMNENIPAQGVTVACSDAPACMTELVEEWGIFSVHVWTISNPLALTCSNE